MKQHRTRQGTLAIAIGVTVALVAAGCSDGGESSSTAETSTSPAATTEPPSTTDSNEDAGAAAPETTEPTPVITDDRAYYILPPGNYGGLPVNENSLDQLPLYDGLTPLRGDITDADSTSSSCQRTSNRSG